MKYQIKGELAQIAELNFNRRESCWCSKGSLMSIDPNIQWQLRIPGGVSGAVRRMFSGEGISLTHVKAVRSNQKVILASNAPGKIIDWDLSDGPVITTRGSFLSAFGTKVDIDVTVAKKVGAAFFGGSGLILQKISGTGKVLIHGSGDFVDRQLKDNESILVSTGNLAAFSADIDYSIQSNKSLRKMFFSGEGIFMTKLTGPGRVLLQSLKR